MTGRVRSGRSSGYVAVIGAGPVAVAVVAAVQPTGRPVRTLATLGEGDDLAGCEVVVLVAEPGSVTVPVPADRGPDRPAAVAAHTQRVVAAARAAGVRRLVAVTSAMVAGTRRDHAVAPDDAPLVAATGHVGELVAVEAVLSVQREAAERPDAPGPDVVVLRPTVIVGPGVDTMLLRHFAAPALLVVRGAERRWQFVHLADLADAVVLALDAPWTGIVPVTTEPDVSTDEVARIARVQRVELGESAAFGAADRLTRTKVGVSPAEELAFSVHSWLVDPGRLHAAGWRPRYDATECVQVLADGVRGRVVIAGRSAQGRDVAWTAVGAAVAALATATLVRRSRARRR